MLKHKGKQLISSIISIAMILGMFPSQVLATQDVEMKEISNIVELDEKIYNQTFSVGEDANVILPEELLVQIQETTIIEMTGDCEHAHIHDLTCGYESGQNSIEETPCTYVCEECASEDTECKHHTHDDTCGYSEGQETIEETPCTFVCDKSHIVEKEQVSITETTVPITWVLDGADSFTTETENIFYYKAELVNEIKYVLADNVELPKITVTVIASSNIDDENLLETTYDSEEATVAVENYLNAVRPFHENNSMTMQMDSYNQSTFDIMDDRQLIDISRFEFICAESGLLKLKDIDISIKTGKIQDSVPQVIEAAYVENDDVFYKHSFVSAYINETQITHIGQLMANGEIYEYYVTKGSPTVSSAYSVLKPNEKITLKYTHKYSISIDYNFENNGVPSELGPNGRNYNEVFGKDRKQLMSLNDSLGVEIEIPRGYKAILTVSKSTDGKEIYTADIGKMPTYRLDGHEIVLESGSVERLELSYATSVANITEDVIVTLDYEKIEDYTFDFLLELVGKRILYLMLW